MEQILPSLLLSASFLSSVFFLEKNAKENYEAVGYPPTHIFYHKDPYQGALSDAIINKRTNVQSNNMFAGPDASTPMQNSTVNLRSSGDQLLEYQLYQQAINASTPTQQQLDAISGYTTDQSNQDFKTAPYDAFSLSGSKYKTDFQAVNYGNSEMQNSISACSQNAPTFVATSLLPKPTIPGQSTWDIASPNDILASQNFLSATQQIGTDTVGSSLRNPSYDIRGDIPNPINVVSPWLMSTITPDLQRKSLSCDVPDGGIYGCPANTNFVGQ